MTTIDNILFKIESHGIDRLSVSIPRRDKKILAGMAKMIRTNEYITESQANLTVKVLRENLEHLNFVGTELITSLKTPTWAKFFKSVEKIRKISTAVVDNNLPVIEITATYKKDLKKVIVDLQKNSEGGIFSATDKNYYILLTEKNVVRVVEDLKRYNFEKSPEISDLYNKIKSIDYDEVEKKINIEYTDNEKLINSVKSDIVRVDPANALMLHDRKIAYQYKFDGKISGIDENSLLYKIATRKNHKVFISNEQFSLKTLAQCLRTLDREPVLLIFDEYNTKSCTDNLRQLKSLLDEMNFSGNVGVYFRFDNKGEGAEFNKLVADYNFNKPLNDHSQIAVLSNGKLPKFFLKTKWYPKTVISFTNHFRNNKTSVYCNSCDLIVYYTPSAPIIGNVDAIV